MTARPARPARAAPNVRAVLLSSLTLVALAGCHDVRACDKGTLFVALTADGAAAGAQELVVDATYGSQTLHSTVAYAGQTSASLALDFPTSYPAGQSLTLTAVAMKGTTALASGSVTTTLAAGCTRLTVALAATVSLVGASSAPAVAASSLSLALPTGTQAGDLLLLCLYANSSTTAATLPAGWTALDELTSTRGFHVWWLSKTADAALADVTVTFAQSTLRSAALVAYRYGPTTPTIDTHSTAATLTGTNVSGNLTFDAPGVTTTHAAERLAAFFVYDGGDNGSWPGVPAGMTKLADTGSVVLFERAAAAAGDTGALEATAEFAGNDALYGTALTAAVAP